jgi:hypothetical protein
MPPMKARLAVHHDNLAVHAAEHIDPLAEQPLARIEDMDTHTGPRHRRGKIAVQISRAITVYGDVHTDAALGCGDQCLLQLLSNLVLEER